MELPLMTLGPLESGTYTVKLNPSYLLSPYYVPNHRKPCWSCRIEVARLKDRPSAADRRSKLKFGADEGPAGWLSLAD